jgi:rod shape-determining protein MreD
VKTSRVLVAAAVVVAALAVQLSFLARLPLPGATPDLVLVCVVALGLARGPGFGLVAGFVAGISTDLAPPADHAVGRWAFVLSLVGYAAGLARSETRRSAFVPVIVVAIAAAASVLMYAALGLLVDDPAINWPVVAELLPTAVLYAVVLSPFVVSAVLAMIHRVEPEPVSRS